MIRGSLLRCQKFYRYGLVFSKFFVSRIFQFLLDTCECHGKTLAVDTIQGVTEMKAFSLSCMIVLCTLAGNARADLIAYWNFNTYDGNAMTVSADVGTGTITITGFPSTQLDNFAGTTINALFGDPAGRSLTVIGSANNNDFLTISFSMSGLQDLVLTYATQKTSTTAGVGFSSNQWAYSNDGVTFANFGSAIDPPTSFGLTTIDLSSIAALDDDPTVFLRYTFDGATSSSGNNRLDNLQFNASPVPEPSSIALAGLGAASLLGFRFRTRRSQAA